VISKVSLYNYRNHEQLSKDSCSLFVSITGENGVGKTNILEAISLFAPGKGIRNASTADLIKKNDNPLNQSLVKCQLANSSGELILSSSISQNIQGQIKRLTKVNDEMAKTSDILREIRMVWITPQMDRIFIDGAQNRRKLIDRITYNFFPLHLDDILSYEKLVKSRLKLLLENQDEMWLSALEAQISDLNVAIAERRKYSLDLLLENIEKTNSNFLRPSIKIACKVTDMLADGKDKIHEALKKNRKIDQLSGRTNFGIHKADLVLFHPQKGIEISSCSTGEQKATLISIILAQAKVMKSISNSPVIMLLDELFSHLGAEFRKELIEEIKAMQVQTWITSVNPEIDLELPANDSTKIEL
jgi:DNA replication and repair protein RecF